MNNSHGTYDDMMNGGGWMVGFAVLTLVLLAIALVAVLANLFLHLSRGTHVRRPALEERPDVRLVLDRRLAHGEIDVEEYQALRAALIA